MKKHRKLVALLIALTFLFSIAAPAMAATPSAEQKSADKLNVLGIIEGYPDGSFGLDREITRAEFAKIAVVAAGMKDASELLKNTPAKFSDVKTGEWYTGWINLAASQGFVKGDPQGTFRPNDNITYAEVVTVLLRLLGYSDNLPGDWPTNYLAKAVTLDITKGVSLDAKAPALRGSVFRMTDKTLDTPMVEWSNDKQAFSEKLDVDDNKIKLIAQSFDGAMKNGLIVDLDWDRNGNLVATVAGTGKSDMNVTNRYDVLDATIVTGAEDVYGLFGSNIEYIVNDDDELVYAAIKDTKIASKDEAEVIGESRVIVDKKTYTQAEGFNWTFFPGEGELNKDSKLVGDKVDVVLNSRGEAQWAFVYDYSGPDVIEEIDGDKVYGFDGTRFEYKAKDVQVFIKDGAIADFDALAEGDLIYVVEDAKNADALVIAVSEVLEGELEKANDGYSELTIDGSKIKTDGKDYLVSEDDGDSFDGSMNDDMFGETISYMLSPAGKIAVVISGVEATQKLYGLAETTVNTARGLETRILTPEGTKAVYYVDSDFDWEGKIQVVNSTTPVLIQYSLNKDGKIDDAIKATATLKIEKYDGNRFLAVGGSTWSRVDSNAAFFGMNAEASKNVASDWDQLKKVSDDINVLWSKNVVKAMYYPGAVESDNYGVVAGTGRDSGGFYYEIFFEGEKVLYNVTSNADRTVAKGELVKFTLSSGKISSITKANASKVSSAAKVTEATADYVRIGADTYYYIDEDTMIVDVTESTKKIVRRVGRDDYVLIHGEDKGFVEIIVIVKESTTPPTVTGEVYDADALSVDTFAGNKVTFNGSAVVDAFGNDVDASKFVIVGLNEVAFDAYVEAGQVVVLFGVDPSAGMRISILEGAVNFKHEATDPDGKWINREQTLKLLKL